MQAPKLLWVDQSHGGLEYYDALRRALVQLGVHVNEWTFRKGGQATLSSALSSVDAVLLGFGWMSGESPLTRSIKPLPEFSRDCKESNLTTSAHTMSAIAVSRQSDQDRMPRSFDWRKQKTAPQCFCDKLPFMVLLNKEYTLMAEKFRWFRAHCVAAAFSVHHDVASFESETAVRFYRISFGADLERFASATSMPC